jgi:hypothetical protein
MNTETTPKIASKVRVLTDATVEADMKLYRPRWMTVEDYAKALEAACREFVEHCKDHRSLDHIGLTVNRVHEDQCSACHDKWETGEAPDLNGGKLSCLCCGALIGDAP